MVHIPPPRNIPGDNRVPAVLAGLIIPQVFAFFFLLGRVTTRIFVVKIWTWDDTLIVSTWICTLSLSVLFGIGTEYGTGHHIKDVPLDLIEASFIISYGGILAYQVALCLTKLSILVFYLRAFPAKREQWVTIGTVIFVTSFSIPLIIGDALQCNPITGQSFVMPGIFCFTPEPFLKASAVLHTVTDAWMIIMVVPVVLTLNVPKSQIYTPLGIISLGSFVIVASIARITTIVSSAGTTDFTFIIADFDIWSVLESCTGLICACAPIVRPLIQRLFPKALPSRISAANSRSRSVRMMGINVSGSRELESQTKPSSPNGVVVAIYERNESTENLVGKKLGHTKSSSGAS